MFFGVRQQWMCIVNLIPSDYINSNIQVSVSRTQLLQVFYRISLLYIIQDNRRISHRASSTSIDHPISCTKPRNNHLCFCYCFILTLKNVSGLYDSLVCMVLIQVLQAFGMWIKVPHRQKLDFWNKRSMFWNARANLCHLMNGKGKRDSVVQKKMFFKRFLNVEKAKKYFQLSWMSLKKKKLKSFSSLKTLKMPWKALKRPSLSFLKLVTQHGTTFGQKHSWGKSRHVGSRSAKKWYHVSYKCHVFVQLLASFSSRTQCFPQLLLIVVPIMLCIGNNDSVSSLNSFCLFLPKMTRFHFQLFSRHFQGF